MKFVVFLLTLLRRILPSAPKARMAAPQVPGFVKVVVSRFRRVRCFSALAPKAQLAAPQVLRTACAAVVCACLAGPAKAQSTPPTTQTTQQQSQPQTQSQPQHKGQVIFSRSIDDEGNVTTATGSALPQAASPTAKSIAQDAEREAVTCTAFDMDVHIRPAEHAIAVRAQLTLRNDGKTPLAHLPLQISSSLNWEQIRVAGKDAAYQVAVLNSDSDHTGQLHEAAVTLSAPLPPGATLDVDATYSGTIESNAQRLLAIGAPDDVALHSDWDQIDTQFTGLRGFGNVVWYPVSSVPVMLGDGAKLFDEIGAHKLRLSGARFRMRLAIEFPRGQAPTLALVNGHPAALQVTDARGDEVAGVASAETERTVLGFEAPSLFVAIRKAHAGTNATAWTTTDNDENAQAWLDAAGRVTPFLQGWLGQQPSAQLTLLDLPDRADAPYETGTMLAASLGDNAPDKLDGVLAHAMTHAWKQSPRAWLNEGLAHFIETLWIEKTQGRDKALSALEADRNALALAEPGSPGDGTGQPLGSAISPIYYRTKAAYVFWMLRDMVGQAALSAALRAYDPAKDTDSQEALAAPQASPKPQSAPPQLAGSFEQELESAAPGHDLKWFFADWVEADKGLPDLSVDSVFPGVSGSAANSWLVAVNVSNAGYAAAEVPVTVRSAQASVTHRVHIPARNKTIERILIQGDPTEVQLNDGTVPETQASEHVTTLDAKAPAKPNGK